MTNIDAIKASAASMGEVINKAAEHLPNEYSIIIEIEKDGYDVRLMNSHGLERTFDGDGIIGQVNDAIQYANGIHE